LNNTAKQKPQDLRQNASGLQRAGFRNFRPTVQARVQMRDGRPAKVSFRGMRGEVIAASGQWCASGDWWTKNAWQQEEWKLEIVFVRTAKSKNQQECHSQNLTCRGGQSNDESAFLQNPTKSRFLAPLGMTPFNNLRQKGLYRFAYDPVRDIWLVRGMFD